MDETHAAGYRTYWIAWAILLTVTLVMIAFTKPVVLILGILVKASIIALWFMHLKYERAGLVLSVVIGILFTGLLLFALIVPDGLAM